MRKSSIYPANGYGPLESLPHPSINPAFNTPVPVIVFPDLTPFTYKVRLPPLYVIAA